MHVSDLQPFAGRLVRVRLSEGSELTGELRTELLSERAIAVFLSRGEGEGATIYIDEIVGIWETS